MNKLYIYTTESDRKNHKYKFGGVFSNRTAESRVKCQQTGNSENLEMITVYESDYTDYYVHEELLKFGYSRVNSGGKEWFQGFKTDDEAIGILGKILSKSKNTKLKEYVPRFFQDYIKMVFEEKLKNSKTIKKDFALELAPRFGKTVWALDLIQTLFKNYEYKVALLPAFVLTALSSFKKEFYSFRGFSDTMVFMDENDNIEQVFRENYHKKMIILPISLHKDNYRDRFNFIKNLPIKDKVSFIDESDFGCHRENSQTAIKFLDCKLNVYMTGTAIDRVISPLENIEENIIRWSYTDMLMIQKGEHPIQKYLSN
jgi:hypothetical protein